MEPSILENLKDAGCDAAFLEAYRTLSETGSTACLLQLLAGQRKALLASVHESQDRLECLDYLIHHIRQAMGSDPANIK